ncbi:MAG TPA: hypothetical protein VK539_05285 [Myxococcaceae bacterium]|nr:hypothetical protein [Myxococcaceae bacterium]
MPPQWKLPGAASNYLVVLSYDKEAKDTKRHVSDADVRAALAGWLKSRRQALREIYETLEGQQSLNVSGTSGAPTDDQLRPRLSDAFFKERKLVALRLEQASASQGAVPASTLKTQGKPGAPGKTPQNVPFRVFLPKNPHYTQGAPRNSDKRFKYKKVPPQEFISLAYVQAFGLKEGVDPKSLGVKIEGFEGRPNETELTELGYVDMEFHPDIYEKAIRAKLGGDNEKIKAEIAARRKKLQERAKSEQEAVRGLTDREYKKRTGHEPSKTRTKAEQRVWDAIQDDVLREEGGTAQASRVRKIIQCPDFLVLLLDDTAQTKVTVPVNLCGALNPGGYKLYYANGKVTLPQSGAVPPPIADWVPPNVSLPPQVDYVVAGLVRLPELDHLVRAEPTVARAPVGTRFKFYVAMPPELGGSYSYKWTVFQDPVTAKKQGVPAVVKGPTSPTLEPSAGFVGRHRIRCELTYVDPTRTSTEVLEYLQVVADEDALLKAAHAEAVAPRYDLFRIDLELDNLSLMKGGLQEQNATGIPYIVNSGLNPSSPRFAPDFSTYTYTVVPDPQAKTFRWYVRCENWSGMATQVFYGYKRVMIDDAPAYDLASTGKSARWIIAARNVYTIVCEQFDEAGNKVGTALYRQVVDSQQDGSRRAKFQSYMKKVADAIGKLQKGKEVGLQAAYVNREAGQTSALSLFVGPAAGSGGGVVLVDAMPGVDRLEYRGANLEAAIRDFERGNSYPEGSIKLTVPPNRFGLPQLTRTFQTKGESDFSLWSTRVGWASLGFTAAGVILTFVPFGQPFAVACFIAAGATGVAAGSLSIYDRLQKAELNGTGVVLDVLGIAGSILGAAGAIRAIKVGAAFAFAGRTGRFFLYTGFTTDALAGVILSAQGVDQINAILRNQELSPEEKTGAVVRILAMLALQGALFALSARELGRVRAKAASILGKDVTARLTPEALQSLNLLDEGVLKRLAGMNAAQLTEVAGLIRIDLKAISRLIQMFGKELADHRLTLVQGRININGQIKIHPKMISGFLEEQQLESIFRISKALKAVDGNVGALVDEAKTTLEKLKGSAGGRLRFEVHLRKAEEYVEKLGAKGSIFKNMTEGERERLFDLANASGRIDGPYLNQANNWALSRRPADVYEYVALFELYVAKFEQALAKANNAFVQQVSDEALKRAKASGKASASEALNQQVSQELTQARFGRVITKKKEIESALREELEMAWSAPSNVTQPVLGARVSQDAYKAGADRLKGRVGSVKIGSGLSVDEAIAQLKKLREVKFAQAADAIYHLEKHPLPDLEGSGDPVAVFFASTMKTIREGTPTPKVTQGGMRQVHFVRAVTDASGTKKYEMLTILNVTETGEVQLATTYANKVKK